MIKAVKLCALTLTGCFLAAGLTVGAAVAAEPERTGYIPPAHNFLYEDNNATNNIGPTAYEGTRSTTGEQNSNSGFLGNSIRTTERRGYIPPAHYFLYE